MEGINEKANSLFHNIKDKLNNTGSYLMIIGEVLKHIFDFMQAKQERRYDQPEPERYEEPSRPRTARTKKK